MNTNNLVSVECSAGKYRSGLMCAVMSLEIGRKRVRRLMEHIIFVIIDGRRRRIKRSEFARRGSVTVVTGIVRTVLFLPNCFDIFSGIIKCEMAPCTNVGTQR